MDKNNIIIILLVLSFITIGVCGIIIADYSAEKTQLSIDLSVINQGDNLTISLTDSNSQPLANKTICATINGVTYNLTTDDAGKAQLAINLNPGDYNISVKFNGETFKYKSFEIEQQLTVQQPPKETQSVDSDSSSGDILVWENELGDKIYQRKDGSVYGISADGQWMGTAISLEEFLDGPD